MNGQWKYEFVSKSWVNIWCPMLTQATLGASKVSFSGQKEILKELRSLENRLKIHPEVTGWISYTDLQHEHIMVLFTRVGASPYAIDVKLKRIWFRKFL